MAFIDLGASDLIEHLLNTPFYCSHGILNCGFEITITFFPQMAFLPSLHITQIDSPLCNAWAMNMKKD